MVPIVKIKGFSCTAEEAVFVNGQDAFAHVLSLVGTREAVKAVWARLMKGESAVMIDDASSRGVRMNTFGGGKLLTERLPSGTFHGLLLSRVVLQGELVLGEHEADLPARYFRGLNDKSRLPLHRDWGNWLWAHALTTGIVTRLASQRLHAYEVNLSVRDLAVAVRQALLAGDLPEIASDVAFRLALFEKLHDPFVPLEAFSARVSCAVRVVRRER